jgi:archaellum component FlaC
VVEGAAEKDAKQKATKYYQDGVDVMQKQVIKQVNEFAANQIMSAKDTLSNFAAKNVEYSENIKKTNLQCKESLEKIKLYESKYSAASKELEGYKSHYKEYLVKVENMDKEMEAIRQIVCKSTDQAQERMQQQLDEVKTLSKDVTDNRTDIERTAKECKDECKAMMEKVEQAKEESRRIFREYKTVESFCKKILKQENTRDQVLFDRMAKVERELAANNLNNRDHALFNRINPSWRMSYYN